jgi:DNA polymerase-3 subunit delta'
MKFSDVPCPESLKASLIQAIDSGQVAHAQLFAGSEGGVSLMLALAYGQYLNCENPQNGDSCGNCISCIKIQKFIHPDFHFCFPYAKTKLVADDENIHSYLPLFRSFLEESPFGTLQDWSQKAEFENRTPIINIKAVRETMQGLQLKAYEAKYKIQIIWLPETMRTEGSNAFLKLLEEPPPYTLFLLVSQAPELLLPTIISRTQRVTVPKLDRNSLSQYLQKQFETVAGKAEAVAALSDGNISDALALLNEKEDDFHHLFMDWQRSCFKNDLSKLTQHMESFQTLGKELQKSFLRYSLSKVRNAMAINFGGDETVHLPEAEFGDLSKFGKIFTLEFITTFMSELETAYYHIDRNASPKMVFFDVSLKLASVYAQIKNKN